MFGRDKPPYAEAGLAIEAIRVLIKSESAISDVRWLYEEDNAA
jgi:hypothetical protein